MLKTDIFFKSKKALILTAAAGLLLVLSYGFRNETEIKSKKDYGEMLEDKIEEMLECASGCENVKVMITFKERKEEEKAATTGSSFFESVSATDSANEEYDSREIAGVMIVAHGISEKNDFLVIKNAVSTVLDISKKQIYIVGG